MNSIFRKIDAFNHATLKLILNESNLSIIKIYTEECMKILEADFGFAWGKFEDNADNKLVYRSARLAGNPVIPQRKKGGILKKRENLIFDNNVKKENYDSDVSYLKSYIIIPVRYGDHWYGSIVLGYKNPHDFTEEELALSDAMGNTIAQAVTINWLLEKEQKDLDLAEKQKETEVLLTQEKSKIEFIANATHELRTPLAIIKGNVDLAALQPAKSKRAFAAINQEIQHLSNILSDLTLITSKGKGLKNRIAHEKIALKPLIEGVIERCKVLACKKNISLSLAKISNITIIGNKIYLEKMLINLVENSINYGNKNGHTIISVKDSGKSITITVADDGIGIDKEDMPYIFERFYRADKSHNSDGKNTGLGLAIVKWVTELHNGTISVQNNKNKGSVFTVSLPIK